MKRIRGLEVGNIDNDKLVSLFGTKKFKQKYRSGNMYLATNNKKSLINKAKKYCDIEDLGNGQYLVHSIHTNYMNRYLLPLRKGLYQNLTPVILKKLLEEQDENYKMTLSFFGWAKRFDMVNGNYSLIKYNQKEGSDFLGVDEVTMYEYFDRVDECIKHHLNETLKVLSSKGLSLVEFNKVTMVRKRVTTVENDDKTSTNVICEYIDEPITDKEMKYVIDCENKALKYANIDLDKHGYQAKYYGDDRSNAYKSKLKELLGKKNIMFTYPAYNIFCKSRERVQKALDTFDTHDKGNFVLEFNEQFVNYINKKAEIRKDKEVKKSESGEVFNPSEIKQHRLGENYIDDMKKITDTTVKLNAEDLFGEFDSIDTIDSILKEFNINIVKNKSDSKK